MDSRISFLDNRKPSLCLGQYHVQLEHRFKTAEMAEVASFTAGIWLSVVGERFSLDPATVHAVFPPAGSRGVYHTAIPHIVLSRATFPWERLSGPDNAFGRSLPWIALLLFDENEIASGDVIQKTTTLSELLSRGAGDPPLLQKIELEIGQAPEDRVVVVDVKKRLLQAILPNTGELGLLAHVRSVTDRDGTRERAVVMGNRLPRQGTNSTAHLVSVEDRYGQWSFDFQNAGDDDRIRLVSLKSWRFSCAPENEETDESFDCLADRLNVVNTSAGDDEASCSEAEKYRRRGYSLLAHAMRNGDRSYSWYHGPLALQEVDAEYCGQERGFPESSDQLMRYLPDIDIYDISYAAAFELGRILALDDIRFATNLNQWKCQVLTRSHIDRQRTNDAIDTLIADNVNAARYRFDEAALRVLRFRHRALSAELETLFAETESWKAPRSRRNFSGLLDERIEDPRLTGLAPIREEIVSLFSEQGRREAKTTDDFIPWLEDAIRLKRVPFNYLVPDEALLPRESIRFFQTDRHWLESMILGAFSIGRSLPTDNARDDAAASLERLVAPFVRKTSGLVLRSALVSHYPDITADCFDGAKNPLAALRMERLSPDILFCLFDGILADASLYLKAEGTHYGLKVPIREFDLPDRPGKLRVEVLDNRTIRITNGERPEGGGSPEAHAAFFATLMVETPSLRRFEMRTR